MWGRHRKRSARLSKQLALGLLEDAMGRAEQTGPDRREEPERQTGPERQTELAQQEGPPYRGAAVPPQAVPPARCGLEPADAPG